ncbi:sulfotransferase domain-containing protein [Lacipirellula sp.]|uniref:sulfotransferase domain-containing protein n=1 Tax=Lacipirellula sp. TaxID=2691419 RepID=UPI003D100805
MSTATAEFLTIVSGLPRSGTSMMMRMLEHGGLEVMTDEIRTADDDNPNGYYEFEAVKKTSEDASWLEGANGKAVKMVYRLLYDLPADRSYRVLFMRRELDEILASQQVMLNRHSAGDAVSPEMMAKLFRSEIERFYDWAAKQQHLELIDVNYNQMLANPAAEIGRVNEFLGGVLDAAAMQGVVDASLYRNRKE